MIFKEAVKSKVRLSITGYEDNASINENTIKDVPKVPVPVPQAPSSPNLGQSSSRGSYGWNLEPPKNDSLI